MRDNINDGSTKKWIENESGILIETEVGPEKREKMARWEWKVYFSDQEITEDEYIAEQKTFRRALNGHGG
jgi:hypothetical protein